MPQRRQQLARRYRKRIEVKYGPDNPVHTGYTGNLSLTGVMLRAVRVYTPGSTLELELKLPTGQICRLKGLVRWAREGPVGLLSSGRIGMGIKMIDPPPEVIRFVEREGT